MKRQKMCVINMRARKADVQLIDRAAKIVGVSRSALMRHAAEAHARRVLAITEEPDDSHATRPDSGRRGGWYGKAEEI